MNVAACLGSDSEPRSGVAERLRIPSVVDRLCELNVIEQVYNVCHTTIVQDAWELGWELSVHGWVYSLQDGLLKDLNLCITHRDELSSVYRLALAGH